MHFLYLRGHPFASYRLWDKMTKSYKLFLHPIQIILPHFALSRPLSIFCLQIISQCRCVGQVDSGNLVNGRIRKAAGGGTGTAVLLHIQRPLGLLN